MILLSTSQNQQPYPLTQEQEKQTNCNLKVFENYYQSSDIYQELTTKHQGGLIVDGRT